MEKEPGRGMQESKGKEIFLWMIRARQRLRVTGNSMHPLLTAGDEILLDPQAYRHQPPNIGHVVVASHPTQVGLQIVKRVRQVTEDGCYQLQGDNPDPAQNSPSQVHGTSILGRVTSRFVRAKE